MTMSISECLVLLKSSLSIHLNHSNRIRNEKVMAKIRTLVKTEQGVPHLYRYRFSSGGLYRYRFKVYRYRSPKNAQNVCFSPIFHMLIP